MRVVQSLSTGFDRDIFLTGLMAGRQFHMPFRFGEDQGMRQMENKLEKSNSAALLP